MSKETAPTLHTLEGVVAAWENDGKGSIYCPGCGDERQADVHFMAGGVQWERRLSDIEWGDLARYQVVIRCACRQCSFSYFGAVFAGGEDFSEPIFVFIPSRPGGVVTPRTPKSVAYYLDQAQRAEGLGATTAALPMYRAALDRVLFIAGYKRGMCGQKLGELEKAVAARTAPEWAMRVDAGLLTVLKKLGDQAIHPDGSEDDLDLKVWSEEDARLLSQVKAAFAWLLDEAYEVEGKRDEMRQGLEAAVRPRPKPKP
jgi:hypothetical protein